MLEKFELIVQINCCGVETLLGIAGILEAATLTAKRKLHQICQPMWSVRHGLEVECVLALELASAVELDLMA